MLGVTVKNEELTGYTAENELLADSIEAATALWI